MKEVWNDIEGYEGFYQVSNFGNVKSLRRIVKQGWGYRIIPERILNKTTNKGYQYVGLYLNGSNKTYLVHRLVANSFIENKKNKSQVNHINCDKTDNKITNLEWCTPKENMKHAKENNLIKKVSRKGYLNNRSKKVVDLCSGKIYDTVASAALEIGYSQPYLNRMLNGQRKNKTNLKFYNEINR